MRHPLWVLNSLLFILVIIVVFFIWFSQERVSRRASLEPKDYRAIVTEAPKINIAKIYQHDLFDSYQETPLPPPLKPLEPPRPPVHQPIRIPAKAKPVFLDPLSISLKGVIIVSQDDSKNMATIADTRTDREAVYKVGDKVEDAQLTRIFKNKVVFVRSNGQQEILYLREKDAKADPAYSYLGGWDEVIEEKNENEFVVDPILFAERVQGLAQFIDIIDLTTAYQKGKSIGCRIGMITENSLGGGLGLKSGDIILSIHGIPISDTASRFEIYKALVNAKLGDTINVIVRRMGQAVTITYKLEEFNKPIQSDGIPIVSEKASGPEKIRQKEIVNMRERYQFAPTVDQIRTRERENMLRRGKRPRRSIAE